MTRRKATIRTEAPRPLTAAWIEERLREGTKQRCTDKGCTEGKFDKCWPDEKLCEEGKRYFVMADYFLKGELGMLPKHVKRSPNAKA